MKGSFPCIACPPSSVRYSSSPPLAADASPVPKVPDGFKCEIVLEAPDIEASHDGQGVFAPNGDVYFAEDSMDMSGPPTKNLDKIWMLKGGDPKKKILIADKMWAVMGLEIVRDKLYVVHAPHVTVFTLDADGKPTQARGTVRRFSDRRSRECQASTITFFQRHSHGHGRLALRQHRRQGHSQDDA